VVTCQISEIINSGIQPLQNVDLLRRLKVVEVLNETTRAVENVDGYGFAKLRVERGLRGLESLVRSCSNGRKNLFAAGTETPSIADCLLIPQLHAMKRFKIDPSPFPYLNAVNELCEAREEFIAASPEKQPDHQPRKFN
jgi:maleylpyruvate isomerase